MDQGKDGMTDVVERLRADVDINNDFVMSSDEFLEAAGEIESLRQQLADCEVKWNDASDCCAKGTALLAESQIELAERDDLIATFERQAIESQEREKMLRDAMATVIGNCILGIHNGRPAYHITANAFAVMVDALALPSAPAALDSDIRQAKQDMLPL